MSPVEVPNIVIVVPGFLGSRLERDGHVIWGGASTVATLLDPQRLRLSGSGLAAEPDVRAVGLVGRLAQFPGLSAIDAYDRLVDQLHERFDLHAANFLVFPYDWRLSCATNAGLLADQAFPLLEARRRIHPDARFVFICHSMGGLVVQHFTDRLGAGPETKEVITLGTPFRGTAKALGVLSQGWPAQFPGIRSRLRRLAQTFPSVYELLPRYRAVIDGDQRRRLGWGDLGLDISEELYAHASEFHQALDVGGPRPYGRTVVVGSLQPTPQFVRLSPGGSAELLREWGHDGDVHDERGDGTVPRQSVTPPEWGDDRHVVPFAQSHVALPTADAIFRVLFNVLTATPREEQALDRARLAVEVADLALADEVVEVGCEVASGDRDIRLLVVVEPADGSRRVQPRSPGRRDGRLVATFADLDPGDYRVRVEPAGRLPDVRPVWTVFTVVDPAIEAGAAMETVDVRSRAAPDIGLRPRSARPSQEKSRIQALLVERLRSTVERAGGWARADPYVLHYMVAHAEQAGPDGGDLTEAPVGELLGDAEFVARAEANRLARAAVRSRGRIDRPIARLVERSVHEFAALKPADRLGLLRLTALQEGLTPPLVVTRAAWAPLWAAWQPSSPHVTLAGHDRGVSAVAFSRDGASLASAGIDGTVRLWDPTTGAAGATLAGHDRGVSAVAFSPDGAVLASAGSDGSVRLWDTTTGVAGASLSSHRGEVKALAFSPDGAGLASASEDGTVRLWNRATGVEGISLSGQASFSAVAFSPDGASLASAGYDGTVQLWDRATGAAGASLSGHRGWVATVAFSPDGAILASAGSDGSVRLWDATTGAARATLPGHDVDVLAVAFSPDGATLASAGSDGTVRLWVTTTGAAGASLSGHEDGVLAVAFSPDGATLASAGSDGTVRLWDPNTGAAGATVFSHKVRAVAVSPDGATLASAGSDGTVRLWDANTGAVRATLPAQQAQVRAVAFSPDGTTLACAGDAGYVELWDLATGTGGAILFGHEGPVWAVAFSPDGAILASAGDRGAVWFWDPIAGTERAILPGPGHMGEVRALAFSPDGAILASAGIDGTVRLLDSATGAEANFLSHPGGALAVVFSPDGNILATAGFDGTVRLWDPNTAVAGVSLPGHLGEVRALVFSPDGATLASSGFDGTVRLWDPSTGAAGAIVAFRSGLSAIACTATNIAVGGSAGIAVIEMS